MTRQMFFTCLFLFIATLAFSQTATTYQIETLSKPTNLLKEHSRQSILEVLRLTQFNE